METDFAETWEQRKLDKVFDKVDSRVDTPKNGYIGLGVRSHGKGTFLKTVKAGEELETATMSRVYPRNFIVNITFGWEQAIAITRDEDDGALVSHRFPQFSFKIGFDSVYFGYAFLSSDFLKHLQLSSPGGAGRNRVLSIPSMLMYEIYVPSFAEQQRIGSFFKTLDSLITLHQRKSENGQNIPELTHENPAYNDLHPRR